MSLWHPKVLVKIRMLTLRLMIERLWNISKTCWYQFLLSLSQIMHSWCRMHQVVHQDVFREEKHTYWWTFRWDSARLDDDNNNKLSFITKAAELHALRLLLLWVLAVDFGAHELKLEIQDCEKFGLFVTTVQFLLSLLPKDSPHKQRTLVIIIIIIIINRRRASWRLALNWRPTEADFLSVMWITWKWDKVWYPYINSRSCGVRYSDISGMT